jgi:sugar lactone lactonase YvrE
VLVIGLVVAALAWSTTGMAVDPSLVKVLARGADFYCPASVRFAPDGEMWMVDGFGSNFVRMNPRSGQVLEVIQGAGGSAAFDIDAEGSIYYIEAFAGNVYKLTRDGERIKLASMHSNCDGLELSDDGRLFVSSLFVINAFWEVDTDGIEPPRKIADVGGLDAFAFAPDGYLYAPDWLAGTGNIFKIDVDTGDIEVFTGGFVMPGSLRFSPDGEMHVFDFGTDQIIRVDMDTKEKTVAVDLRPGCDDFAFSPEGEIFYANMQDGFVGKVLPNGMTLALSPPGLSNPGGISVRLDDKGHEQLWVGDGWAVRRYNGRSGVLEKTYYTNLTNPSGIFGPFSLADDGVNLILTNALFNMVQVWSTETEMTQALYPDFAVPLNATMFQGELIVAELVTGNVVRASDRTPLISGLVIPAGLAVDGDDLYVGDWVTGIIWKAVEDGTILTPPVEVASGLVNPEGITVDQDGSLLVVEVGAGRLSSVDPDSGDITLIADGLAVGLPADGGGPPTWVALSSVAVSPAGDLYLTGDIGNVIYTIKR